MSEAALPTFAPESAVPEPVVGLGHGFWARTPVVAWVQDLSGHILGASAQPCDGRGAASLAQQFRTVLPDQLEREAPLRTTEFVAGSDGDARHYLLVRYLFGHGSTPLLGHVALDVSHLNSRVDELASQAVQDELTGLYNRRGFLLFAEHELRASHRRLTQSAVVLVDIDGLAAINEQRGHATGNALLVDAATLLREVFRECDVIARLGGDEFAVFASDVRGEPSYLRNRLLSRLARWRDEPEGPKQLSISAGMAYCGMGQVKDLEQLLAEADHDLCRDKARR